MRHSGLYRMFYLVMILLAILFISMIQASYGQQFIKTYGGTNMEAIWSMQPTNDEGYIMTGYSSSFFGLSGAGVYIVRTNKYGDTVWTRVCTGTSSGLYAMQTPDGGYIATGGTYASGAGSQDGYFIRMDSNGHILWAKTYGGPVNDEIICALPAFDSGYILCGSTSSFGAGSFDIYIIRTNANGDTLWTKTFGGPLEDAASTIRKTADSGYIIAGQTKSYGAGIDDAYLLKIDKNGNYLWAKTYGGTDADVATAAEVTPDSGFILVGKTHSYGAVSNDGDVLLIRTDKNGDTLWARTYGAYGTDWGRSVFPTADGGFAITGDTWAFGAGENDIYLVKTTGSGMLQWSHVYGGSLADNGIGIHQATDGGYVMACFTENFGAGVTDYCLIKTDSLGGNYCNEGIAATVQTSAAVNISSPMIPAHFTNTVVLAPTLPNGRGGTIISNCSPLSVIESVNDAEIMVNPNPCNGSFTLTLNNVLYTGKISLLNILGQTVREIPVKAKKAVEITVPDLSPGMYFLKLNNASNVTKIIVQ